MMSAGPTPKRLRQSILKFSRSTPAGSFPHLLREVNTPTFAQHPSGFREKEGERGRGGRRKGEKRREGTPKGWLTHTPCSKS